MESIRSPATQKTSRGEPFSVHREDFGEYDHSKLLVINWTALKHGKSPNGIPGVEDDPRWAGFPLDVHPQPCFLLFFLLNHQLFADFFCNMFLFNHHVYEYGISLWIWTIHEYIYIILLYIYIYIQSTLIIINHHSSTFQRNKHPPINSIDPSRRRGQVWSSWRTGRAQLMASLARQQERPGGPEPARCFRYFGGGMTLFGHHSDVIIYN